MKRKRRTCNMKTEIKLAINGAFLETMLLTIGGLEFLGIDIVLAAGIITAIALPNIGGRKHA